MAQDLSEAAQDSIALASRRRSSLPAQSDPELFAALDLGTNSCRMLIAVPEGGHFRVVDAFAKCVRLGNGLERTGHLSRGAIGRTLAALEICAEKLRCVIQRRQCRDVYDLWALLDDRGGADLFEAWHRFERKAEHRDLDPARFFDRWEDGVDWYGARWDAELEDYLGEQCPDFDSVARALARRVGELRDHLG